ncbi:MAG: glycosyltransferase family 4 protein [Anaerolineae bacterium]|nr:glycosyltransferase family 4 protein [Anaerolineae bacterium]
MRVENTYHIGLNAHLLSSQMSYRRAGIHTYLWGVLEQLPTLASAWQFTAMVGEGTPPPQPNLTVRRSRLNTARPLNRIAWEQFVQPWQLGEFDLVHEMAFVAPALMPRPFVVTVYDLTFIRFPERLPSTRRLYLQLMTRLTCQRAKRVIAISNSTADDLVTFLNVPRAKIDLALPGIDPRFRPLPVSDVEAWRTQRGLPARFFLCVCTLEPRKNLGTLIKAYAALPAADRERVHLVLAGGKGWMYEEIDALIAQHDLAATVHRPGFVSDDDLVWWYNAAEAFVYPSSFEGWGMPITEAMACGKPIIASNVSSLPEAVGDTGLLVAPHDVDAWTNALAHALADANWRQTAGERARLRASGFTWRSTAQQTIESYKKALGKSSQS